MNKVGYNNLASFTHLGHVCGSGSLLVVHPSTPFRSVRDVIELSKKDPDKWSYGTSGVGGPHHLSGEYSKSVSGASLVHVPYKGGAPAMTDLMGGLSSDSDRDFDGIATLRRRVFSGQSRETKTGGSMQLASDHRRPVRAAPSTRAQSDVTSAPRRVRILVADDDRDSVLTLMMLLRDEGHEVRGVYNGQQALKAVLDFEPHAVMLDIALPDLSGWEVARRIRQRNTGKGPLLIGLSGEYKQGADRILSEIIGFDHYVLKPYDIHALLGLLAPLTLPDAQQ